MIAQKVPILHYFLVHPFKNCTAISFYYLESLQYASCKLLMFVVHKHAPGSKINEVKTRNTRNRNILCIMIMMSTLPVQFLSSDMFAVK